MAIFQKLIRHIVKCPLVSNGKENDFIFVFIANSKQYCFIKISNKVV